MAINVTSQGNKKRKPIFFKRKGFWLGLLWLMFLLGVLSAVGGYIGYRMAMNYLEPYRLRAEEHDLETINKLELPSLIVDRNGKEIGRFFAQNRSVVSIDEVPEVFIDALRAGEDQRFLSHNGVDPVGIVRAFYLNWKAGKTTQGASTITQQLARNAYDLEGERKRLNESGMQRKIVEAFLAMRIEKRYSKREILEFYLNRIYFGSGYYGIRSASLGYFGKEPRKLNALESAAIVGCIKNPSNLSPLNNPDGNRRSRNLVLERMVDLGALKRSEARELYEAKLKLNPKPLRRGTSHVYAMISDAVRKEMGEDRLAAGGFTIHTTILAEAQAAAEKALEASLQRAEQHPGFTHAKHRDYVKVEGQEPDYLQGACLMIDKETGEVLAHVGGRDYADAPYDFIESGRRPLGTAFYPFIAAVALEQGLPPTWKVEDQPMDNRSVMVGGREGILGEWGMEMESPVYEGDITLRRALEASKVAAMVRLADEIGLEKLVSQVSKFGFPLGDAELLRRIAVGFESASMKEVLRATCVFGQEGKLTTGGLVYLDRIEDANGKTFYKRKASKLAAKQVIDPATAWQVHDILRGSLMRGSAAGLSAGMVEQPFHGAAKGGTTHDFSDCWFLGYNKRVACGVWTGFLNGSGDAIYPGAFSRDLAMPVWQAAMNAASPYFPGESFSPPEDIVVLPVCSVSGQRSTQFCSEYQEDPQTQVVKSMPTAIDEYFRKGADKLAYCQVHAGVTDQNPHAGLAQLETPKLDAMPVRPKSPVLLGDDPYHSEVPGFSGDETAKVVVRRRTNVMDSLDVSDREERLTLPRPGRLEILDE